MSPRQRLAEAVGLIRSVMDELDFKLVACPCPKHSRHYTNWEASQVYIRLEGIADRLENTLDAVDHPSMLRRQSMDEVAREIGYGLLGIPPGDPKRTESAP